jgi:hypothetical protein
MSTKTDDQGVFWFRNVGNGTYDLECTLEGYGSLKLYGIKVFGNDTVTAPFLSEMSALPDKKLKLPVFTSANLHNNVIEITTDQTECGEGIPSVIFFFGNDDQVSYENYSCFSYSGIGVCCNCEIYIYDIENTFASNDKVYVVGYIIGQFDDGYMDMHSGRKVFPTINTESRSNVISFIMP